MSEEDPQEDRVADAPGDVGEKPKRGLFREAPFLIFVALVLALVIKGFLLQAFVIPSTSMVPTLERGDRVLVNKLAMSLGGPSRGEVLVFHNPLLDELHRGPLAAALHWMGEGLGVGQPMDEFLIKRVVGLPGDTVSVKGDGVYINGRKLAEPYANLQHGAGPLGTWNVPRDSLFMMGDNRGDSEDSRVFGAIPVDTVVGRAFLRMWPPTRWGGL